MPRLFGIRRFNESMVASLNIIHGRTVCGAKEIGDETLEITQCAISDSKLEDAMVALIIVAMLLGIFLMTMRFGLWTRMKNQMA